MSIFGNTITSLEYGLQYASTKGKVISQNIANVDTPNYKAKSVSFKDILANVHTNSLQAYRTDERHLNFNNVKTHTGVFTYSNFRYRQDGNGVDMDKEQADLAANQIYYNALVDRINGKFNSLQNVLKGGR